MSVGDTIIDMPTDLRNDDDATTTSMELEPLQGSSSTHTGNAADLHANNGVKPSRRGILRLTVDVPVQSPSKPGSTRPAPRWRTPEFMFYGVVFSVVVPLMVWKPIDLSRGMSPTYPMKTWSLDMMTSQKLTQAITYMNIDCNKDGCLEGKSCVLATRARIIRLCELCRTTVTRSIVWSETTYPSWPSLHAHTLV